MIVERIGNRRVLCSSLTGLAIVMSSAVVLGQQQQPQQQTPPQSQPSQQQQQPQQPQSQQQQQSQQQPQQQAGQPAERQGDVQVAAAAPAAGAQALPMWNGVRILRVKPDRIGEFEGLLEELREAAQEDEQFGDFAVWSMELGEMNTYHIVAPFDSFASFASMDTPPMEPAEWANWLNRMGSTIDSHTLAVARMRPDLSIVPEEQPGQQPPELLVLVTDTVMPGKIQEYETLMRDELLPALRQGGIEAAIANEMTFGTEGRTWVYAVPIPGWQEFDGPPPLIEALGPEAAQQLMQRGDALVERSKTEVLRYRTDLSSQTLP